MYNDIHLKCTVRNKKINQGNAVFTPDTDQDIAPKEMEHMTVHILYVACVYYIANILYVANCHYYMYIMYILM